MPDSEPSDLLGEIYAQWAAAMAANPDMPVEQLRIIFDDWQRATAEPEEVTYRETNVGNVPGLLVTPLRADAATTLLVLHGGGFALGSSSSHRKMAGHLARECEARAFVADFRLAPEHPFPAAVEDAVSVYRGLLAEGIDASDIVPVGDSAGASVALAMVLRLRELRVALPTNVVAISPWLDMENGGSTIETNDATDFLITRQGLQANIERYLGEDGDPKDPLANPLYADLRGFPRLYVCASKAESLYDDAVRLVAIAERDGVEVTTSFPGGMQHVYPMLAGRHPRADEEIRAIAAWLRKGPR